MTILQHSFDAIRISQASNDTLVGNILIPKGYTNLTEMCKVKNKDLLDYLRLAETKKHTILEKNLKGDIHNDASTLQGLFTGIVTFQGTWGHIEVAKDLAKWIDVEFGIWADKILVQVFQSNFP